ncbi:MAG: response regulator [Dehalococcoidia bacterium]|nr:response regulator [Dehalococcoidia bacterium]
MRILITEDEKDLAEALARGMRQQGYAADIAYDGEEALVMAEVNDYDLIILDLNLPKIDGVEVCRRIRASGSPVGILMLTARSRLDDRVNGLDQGADDYMVKPFHFPELLARVRAILRREGEPRHPILINLEIPKQVRNDIWLQPILLRKINEEQSVSPADSFPFLSSVLPLVIGMT